LKNNHQLQRIRFLLDFAMMYHWQSNYPIPIEFYDFLQDISMDNRELLSTQGFSSFINRFEFAPPFDVDRQAFARMPRPEISFAQYLFEELNIAKTPEDERFLELQDFIMGLVRISTEEEMELFQEWRTASNEFQERHQEHLAAYQKKYVDVLVFPSQPAIALERWEIRDSVLTHVLHLEPGIIYDITKIRSLNTHLQGMTAQNREEHLNLLIGLVTNISEPFLRQEAARLYVQNLPTIRRQVGEELPDTYAAAIFRELIAPFSGKTVLVNFWAIFCSPCIGIISEQKALREKYKDSAEIAFVFITCVSSSPLDRYEEFVKEQGLAHSFRLSADQMNHLRQLFRFFGVPRYVLVDRQGRILDDNFRNARLLNVSEPLLPQLLN
jgi:thiol-disulfide isomerase/thioredoxin